MSNAPSPHDDDTMHTATEHDEHLAHDPSKARAVGTGTPADAQPILSIAIKALNEEEKIAGCIESAIRACEACQVSYEIVLADSISTDRTLEIAGRYPVRIVQFSQIDDRGCGAGVQLGYAYTRGKYVYVLDGDMEFADGFLPDALRFMEEHPEVGGVGGTVTDTRVLNFADQLRVVNKSTSTPGEARWLGQGGLYRRAAIDAAGGYAADRNLLAYEEADLGMRLRSAGYRIVRMPVESIRHTGHDMSIWEIWRRHWRSGRARAGGVVLRAAFGRPWLKDALKMLLHPILMFGWWVALLASLLLPTPARWVVGGGLLAVLAGGLLVQVVRKRSLRHVLISLYHWNYAAAGTLLGLFERRMDPSTPIAATVLREEGTRAPRPGAD